ncbi:DUF6174 domain-containing protein [Candidatus Poribacteria bacterium]
MINAKNRVSWHQLFIPIVPLCLFISSCGLFSDGTDWSIIESELRENMNKWNSFELINYQYVMQYTCCGPIGAYPIVPARISIRDDMVDLVTFLRPSSWSLQTSYWSPEWPDEKSFTPQELGEARESSDPWLLQDAYYWDYPTIEELFDLLQNSISVEPDEFIAEYDPEYGYPTKVWIDYELGSDDDENAFIAHSLISLDIPFSGEQQNP